MAELDLPLLLSLGPDPARLLLPFTRPFTLQSSHSVGVCVSMMTCRMITCIVIITRNERNEKHKVRTLAAL